MKTSVRIGAFEIDDGELHRRKRRSGIAGAMFTRKPRQWRMMYWLLSSINRLV